MRALKILLLALLPMTLAAQTRPFSIFYNFAGSYVNPAEIGRAESIQGSAFYRHFFSPYAKSPNFMGLDASFPFKRFYLGVTYLRTRNGYEESNEIDIDLAYKLDLSYAFEHTLTFGLAPIFEIYSLLPINPLIKDPDDPNFSSTRVENFFKPNVRLGLTYIMKAFSLSFSIPYLLSTVAQVDNKGYNRVSFNIRRFNFFLSTAYDFRLNQDLVLKALLNQRLDVQYNLDAMAFLLIKEIVGVGLYYTTIEKLGLLLTATALDAFTFTYNFQMGFSDFYKGSAGVHEIGFLWKVPERKLVGVKHSRLTN